eukprot:SAG25_NODE_12019_length_289_cov_1.168421_1_plen_96_part_11
MNNLLTVWVWRRASTAMTLLLLLLLLLLLRGDGGAIGLEPSARDTSSRITMPSYGAAARCAAGPRRPRLAPGARRAAGAGWRLHALGPWPLADTWP